MRESNLRGWVEGWNKGIGEDCQQTISWLWKELHVVAVAFLTYFVDDDKAREMASGAFWAALEEIELKMGGGILLTEGTHTTKQVTLKNGQKVLRTLFLGKASQRLLTERVHFVWRGEDAFRALFRTIWTARCWDAIRQEGHQWEQVALVSSRNEEELSEDVCEDEKMASDTPDGAHVLFEKDNVCAFIEGLAQVAEQLAYRGQALLAETVDALILAIKWQVLQVSSPNAIHDIVQLRLYTIEELLQHSAVAELDFDEAQMWSVVQEHLQLKQDALYQRKARLYASIGSLPMVPKALRGVVGLLWRRDMYNWVQSCCDTTERLQQQHHTAEADILRCIEMYLRWTFAQGHVSHCHARLEWIQVVTPAKLFQVNNPALLTPIYPTLSHFQQSVKNLQWPEEQILTGLLQVRHTINRLQPCPRRLLTVLDALISKKDRKNAHNSRKEV